MQGIENCNRQSSRAVLWNLKGTNNPITFNDIEELTPHREQIVSKILRNKSYNSNDKR